MRNIFRIFMIATFILITAFLHYSVASETELAQNRIDYYKEKLNGVEVVSAWSLPYEKGVNSIAVSPQLDRFLAGGYEGMIALWGLKDGVLALKLQSSEMLAQTLFCPSGQYAVSWDGYSKKDNELKLWDLERGSKTWSVKIPAGSSYKAAFSPDGKFILLAAYHSFELIKAEDGTVVWDGIIGTGVDRSGYPFGVSSIAFSYDGSLAFMQWKTKIFIRDVAAGKELSPIEASVGIIGTSPNKTSLALGSVKGMISIWDYAFMKQVASWKAHEGKIDALRFSKDGASVITVSLSEGTAKIWNVSTNSIISKISFSPVKVLAEYNGIVVISNDGNYMFLVLNKDVVQIKLF